MPDDPLYNKLPEGLPPLPQLTTTPKPMAPPLAPVPPTGNVGTPLPAKAVKGAKVSTLPPLPQPTGNRPYQQVGAAINEENHARSMLGAATDVEFSKWYTNLPPEEKLKFSPSTVNTGINGIGAGQPLTAAELEGRQRALAKQHFMGNIAPVHPDLAPQRQTLEDATLARIQGVPTQAIRNQRLASTPPPQAPEDPKITAQKLRNEGAVDVARVRNEGAVAAAAAKPPPNAPTIKAPAPGKPAAPIPDGYDHVPTASEQKAYDATLANWRATDLKMWGNKMTLHNADPTSGTYPDPGPAPKPPAQPWLKKPGGVTSVAPDYTNNNATAASAANAPTSTMTPSSSIGTALPAQAPAAIPGSPTGIGAGVLANTPPIHSHTAVNPTTGQRIGFNPTTKQWEPIK